MIQRCLTLFPLALALAAMTLLPACEYQTVYTPPTPAQQVADARTEINHERRLRQSIVLVAPKEKAVLEALRADERVKSAQFTSGNTYTSSGFIAANELGVADTFWFVVVFETKEPVDAAQAQVILQQALASGGLNPMQPEIDLVSSENVWASVGGFSASLVPISQPASLGTDSFEHLLMP